MVGGLAHFMHEPVQLVHARDIGGDGDGARRGLFVGEGVEGVDGFIAGGGFAGGDVDLGAAGLEETVFISWLYMARHGIGMGWGYPDAACSPSPLEPPVTTATLPSREKSEEKLSR